MGTLIASRIEVLVRFSRQNLRATRLKNPLKLISNMEEG